VNRGSFVICNSTDVQGISFAYQKDSKRENKTSDAKRDFAAQGSPIDRNRSGLH
jgi:hypothetical protein